MVTGLTQATVETVAPTSALPAPDARPARVRFLIVYACLGLILVASLVAFVVFGLRPGLSSSPQWSPWKPKTDRLPVMAKEIADHIGPTYQFAKGGQLVAIVPSPPAVTAGTSNVSIVAVATRERNSSQLSVTPLEPGATEMYTLCGLGARCAIASGTPSKIRGRLIRREALEVALHTFKHIPAVDSVLMYMPPGPQAGPPTVLYFTRESLSGRLDLPLEETLSLKASHRVGQEDPSESALVEALTVPRLFTAGLIQLPVGGALLTLTPLEGV